MSANHQKQGRGTFNEFLAWHAVFTVDELDRFLASRGSDNSNTRKSLLNYHRRRGRVVRVRRGLYATVPLGLDPESTVVDPYLVAANMTEDAVLAYHTAMEFHGRAYSVHWRFVYVSARKSLPLTFQSHTFRGAPVPPPLLAKGEAMFGVTCHHRSGVEVRVTNHERTLVDMLDRPGLAGSWEEIWRSLESVEFFRFGSSHRVHASSGKRHYCGKGGVLSGTAQRTTDGGRSSPRFSARTVPTTAPLYDARQASTLQRSQGLEPHGAG